MLEDEALVLFRTPAGISCLRDLCPHRFAPLSEGRLIGDEIECPYHGWRFNGAGHCTKIPLHQGPLSRRKVMAYDVRESHGLIFVSQDAARALPLYLPKWDEQPFVRSIMESECESTLEEAVENVLDPIHTLFVHRGLLRGSGGNRTTLEITATVQEGVLSVQIDGEKGQDGLLSRLIEGVRAKSLSTFRMPGIVELEYWGPKTLNLVTTLYFTRLCGSRHKAFAVMTGPNRYGLGYLKSLIFVPVMKTVIRQDQAIIEASHKNWERFGRPLPAASPLDVFRPGIDAVLRGAEPAPGEESRRIRIEI